MELLIDSTAALSCFRAVNNRNSLKSFGFSNNIGVSISPRKVLCKTTLFAISNGSNDRCIKCLSYRNNDENLTGKDKSIVEGRGRENFDFVQVLLKNGVFLATIICGVFIVFECRRVMAAEGVVNAGYGVIGQSILLLRNAWPKTLQVLMVLKEQGLILAALLGLSAFFSMAETSITTLWPWKVIFFALFVIDDVVYKYVIVFSLFQASMIHHDVLVYYLCLSILNCWV